jgi:hypothetical protein
MENLISFKPIGGMQDNKSRLPQIAGAGSSLADWPGQWANCRKLGCLQVRRLQKLPGGEDAGGAMILQHKQIFVASHKEIRTCMISEPNKIVVLVITRSFYLRERGCGKIRRGFQVAAQSIYDVRHDPPMKFRALSYKLDLMDELAARL